MKNFKGFVICSDFDYTLRRSDQSISEENSKAIKYFQDNGGLFTVATGRHSNMISEFSDYFVPNTYVIIMNGTMIYDIKSKKVILSYPMEKESSLEIIHYIVENYPNLLEIRIHNGEDILKWKQGINADEIIKAVNSELKFPLYKGICIGDPHMILDLKEDLQDKFGSQFGFERSFSQCLEIHSKDSGKGACIKKLKELLGASCTIIGVGDYENDISLIRNSDIGIAVANATDSVKEVADIITVSNDENAIAKIIYDIEKGIIK